MYRLVLPFAVMYVLLSGIFCKAYCSVDDMKKDVAVLCSDSLAGRLTGTEESMRAARYIYERFSDMGLTMLDPSPGDAFSLTLTGGDTVNSVNVMAYIEGYDPDYNNEIILVGAHYDHLGVSQLSVDGKNTDIVYPGADNNASGCAVMLEIADILSRKAFLLKRSVLFVAFGASEQGLLGSWYFTHGANAISGNVKMMVNLDMLGRSGDGNSLKLFTMNHDSFMSDLLHEITFMQTGVEPELIENDIVASDHRMFYGSGVPVTLFTTGMHRDYNTPRDTPEKLDYSSMWSIARYISIFVEKYATADKLPVAVASVKLTEAGSSVYSLYDVDTRPTFLNGSEKSFLDKWVYYYIKYPESSLKNGVQGTVIVEFTVGSNGEVRDVHVTRGLDEAIDAEVEKVVSASPKWKPAKKGGEKVAVKISLPVEFRLK